MVRELTEIEIEQVSGGDGELAMAFAGSWASTVTSAAVGFTVGGPVGGLVGGFAGFTLGSLVSIGYYLSQPTGSGGSGSGAERSSGSGSLQGSINRTGGSRISEPS